MLKQHTTPSARIIALEDDVQPQELLLVQSESVIGRAPGCDIVIDRRTISRRHARISYDGVRYLLHDAESANGTFINGARISSPHLLRDGDHIGLGAPAAVLRFSDPDPTFVPTAWLRYDDQELRFTVEGRPLSLTPAQLRLLLHLYQRAESLCTRESCARAVWGQEYDPGRDAAALDRIVANLRAVLRAAAPARDPIETRRGAGYVLRL